MPYYILIPFFAVLAVYLVFEQKHNFRVATTLKMILSGTFTAVAWIGVCLVGKDMGTLLPAVLIASGLSAAIAGDYFLQYIKLDAGKFRIGIICFSVTQVLLITGYYLILPVSFFEFVFLAILLVVAFCLMRFQKWDVSEQNPQITIYTVLLAFMAAKALTFFVFEPVHWQLAIGGILFFLSDMMLGIWNYHSGKMRFAHLDWIFYFSAEILIAYGIWFL